MNSKLIGLAMSLTAVLAGCGGGGGGGGTLITTTALDPLAITAANAADAAGVVAIVTSYTVGAGVVGSAIVTGVAAQPADMPALTEVIRWTLERLGSLRGQLIPATVTGAVFTVVQDCTNDGTVTVTWDDADNDLEFSTGDTFSLVFSNCSEPDFVINGGLSLTGFTLVGDPAVAAPWSMAAVFRFTTLRITAAAGTVQFDGGLNYSADTADGIELDVLLTGSTLTVREGGYSNYLRSFNIAYTENLNTQEYSATMHGTLDARRVDGRVVFETTSPLTGIDIVAEWPTAGTLLIRGAVTGATNSSVLLEALGGDNIRLDIDANGDTAVDQSIFTTWTDITTF